MDTLDGTVICHPYRTALVRNVTRKLRGTEARDLATRLEAMAGVSRGNHVVFEYTPSDGGEKVYYFYSDHTITVGSVIRMQRW